MDRIKNELFQLFSVYFPHNHTLTGNRVTLHPPHDILHENDTNINHNADSYGNTRKGDDIRFNPCQFHDHESGKHRQRQHCSNDNRRAKVKYKNQDHNNSDENFMCQRALKGSDRFLDQLGAVIKGYYRDSGYRSVL